MGCCLTTTVPSKNSGQQSSSAINGALTPVLDQETVKEVLSETQTPVSQPSISIAKSPITTTDTAINNRITSVLQSRASRLVTNRIEPNQPPLIQRSVKKIEPNARIKETTEEEIKIVPEVSVSGTSEMYSFSGSFSTTTTVKDRDESGEVTQTISDNPYLAKRRSCSSEINAAKHRELKSPASSSQVKYQVRSRPAQGRSRTLQHCNVGLIKGHTSRGCGAQKTVLPARRNEVIGRRKVGNRTPVWNVTGHSGGRLPVRKVEGVEQVEKFDDVVARESLDHPRVSMECFIFL